MELLVDDSSKVITVGRKPWQRIWYTCFPLGFCLEFRRLIRLALPIAVTSLFSFTSGPVSIAFCGRLGKTELATSGLAMSVFNMAGMFVIHGFLTASDTIFSQTYGSNKRYKISMQLKKTLVVITICCIPCCALYICIEPILYALGQNPQIAQLTSGFLLRLIPALYCAAWGQALTKYVQNQNHVYAPLMFTVLTNGLNALLHYIFLFQLHMGINGSAFAQTAAYLFQVVCFFLYICCSSKIVKLNAENTCEFLEDWGSWIKLALPGLVMVSMEGTLFELGGLVAGTIGEKELAVQTVLISLDTISYMLIPHGFGTATGIRVGQYLGSQIPLGPRSVLSVALAIIWFIAPFYYIITVSMHQILPKMFSGDPGVIQLTSRLIPLIALFQILDGANGVCSGVLRGSGLQYIGAAISFFSLYIIGAPLSTCLVFLAGLNIEGIWIGLIVGTVIQVALLIIFCYRVNWKKQVELTTKRLKIENEFTENHTTVTDNTLAIPNCGLRSRGQALPCNGFTVVESELNENTGLSCKLIWKRISLLTAMLLILAASICSRCFLNLSEYFGPYCIFSNGTFIKVSKLMNKSLFNETTDFASINCTTFFP